MGQTQRPPYVFVHGYKHDPRTWGPDHAEFSLYPLWRKMLSKDTIMDADFPFLWFSNPSIWQAWSRGYYNTYRYAWHLADKAADELALLLTKIGQCNIVCHSLGSRVTLLAIRRAAVKAKVLILNGAEYSSTGRNVADCNPQVQFYNVVVPADDVLNKLAIFAPGLKKDKFLGVDGVSRTYTGNWQDLNLCNSMLIDIFFLERDLPLPRGDNPDSIGDHWYSFHNEKNWPLYRAIFDGTWDAWRKKALSSAPSLNQKC